MPRRIHLAMLILIGISPFYLNGWYNPRLAGKPAHFWMVEVLTWIALPLAILLYARWQRLLTLDELGFHARIFGRRSGLLLVATVVVAAFIEVWADGRFWDLARRHIERPSGQVFRYQDVLPEPGPSTGGWRLLAVIYLSLSAGFVEEIYYRGMLRRVFGKGWLATTLFLVVSCTLFAGSHWEGGMQKLAYTFGVGVVTGLIFIITGNLWPVIVGHCAVDLRWFWG